MPNAYPGLDDEALAGGRRSGPSNLPGIHEAYLAVETAIGRDEVLLRLALEAKYVYGYEAKTRKYVYDLGAGQFVEIEADQTTGNPTGPEPVSFQECAPVTEESFDLKLGLRRMQPVTERTRRLLDHAAILLGTSGTRILQDAAVRFERHTLPRRAGW